jgi:hypothetical protein
MGQTLKPIHKLDALKANPSPLLNDLNVLNKAAGNIASAGKGGPDTAFGSAVRGTFSDYASGLGQDDLATGNVGATASLARAQQLWAQQAKLGRVEDALESASDRASASGSGANIDNATRQRLIKLKAQNGWTPDEQDAIQGVIDGTPTGNAVRTAGRMLGGPRHHRHHGRDRGGRPHRGCDVRRRRPNAEGQVKSGPETYPGHGADPRLFCASAILLAWQVVHGKYPGARNPWATKAAEALFHLVEPKRPPRRRAKEEAAKNHDPLNAWRGPFEEVRKQEPLLGGLHDWYVESVRSAIAEDESSADAAYRRGHGGLNSGRK